jgi:signal transduction histidine kinase
MISEYTNPKVTFGNAMSFAVVVMGVFLSVFASVKEIYWLRIVIMIVLGICYVFIGIYIYSISAANSLIWLRFLYIFVELLLAVVIIVICEGAGISLLILLPIVGHSVILFTPRTMLAINGIIALLYFGAGRILIQGWTIPLSGLPIFLAGQIFVIIFMQMYIEEENAHTKIKQLINELETANSHLQEHANQIEELTVVRERNRFAREIHDGLGHYLTVIHMQIQAAKAVMETNPDKAMNTLINAQKQSQEALMDVRRSVATLRDNNAARIPLEERINQLIASSSTDSLIITNVVVGEPRIGSAQLELTVFRIIQESIQNCIKHARATKLQISIDYSISGILRLFVHDNGIGRSKIQKGFGLRGMEERVKQYGGIVNYQSKVNEGFMIEVELPL